MSLGCQDWTLTSLSLNEVLRDGGLVLGFCKHIRNQTESSSLISFLLLGSASGVWFTYIQRIIQFLGSVTKNLWFRAIPECTWFLVLKAVLHVVLLVWSLNSCKLCFAFLHLVIAVLLETLESCWDVGTQKTKLF